MNNGVGAQRRKWVWENVGEERLILEKKEYNMVVWFQTQWLGT